MFQQRDAIIRLLRDEDRHTVELVKTQLSSHGRESVPNLLDLLSVDDARVSGHVREILGLIDSREAREELTELCLDFPDHGEYDALEYAAFLLARALSPGADVDTARQHLDEWGAMLRLRLPLATTPAERVRLLGEFFGRELGFHGNADDYYNAKNSLLPTVIATRLGIPITLALVYIFAGARAGIQVEGISFPGHFLIRHEGVLFDPFERGQVLSITDCAAILMRQNLTVDSSHFAAAPARIILRRMFANLLYIYQSEDKNLAAVLAGWMHDLEE